MAILQDEALTVLGNTFALFQCEGGRNPVRLGTCGQGHFSSDRAFQDGPDCVPLPKWALSGNSSRKGAHT